MPACLPWLVSKAAIVGSHHPRLVGVSMRTKSKHPSKPLRSPGGYAPDEDGHGTTVVLTTFG